MPSEGPNYADSVTSEAEDGGAIAWTNPGNGVGAADSTYATVSLGSGAVSEALTFLDFDFAIPASATIVGVVVGVCCLEGLLPDTDIRDNHVRLVIGGTRTGDDKADTVNPWPAIASLDFVDHGGAADTWGSGLTASQANTTATFGFSVSAKQYGSATRTASVDSGRMTLYYTEGAPNGRRLAMTRHGRPVAIGIQGVRVM